MIMLEDGSLVELNFFSDLGKGIKKAAKFQRGLAELKTSFVGFIQVVLEGITGETGIGPQMSKLAQQLKGFGKGLVDFIKEI